MENNINGNPWKGLSSYTYQDADRFYGRDQELKDITSVIKQNAFTTLYGISGAGKTSIINAGLFPLLDKQSFLPIYIRLDHNAGHIPYDMQVIKAVDNALASIDAESEIIVGHDIKSELDKLWLYFHSRRFWSKDNYVINPIIFIDQFEEIFTKNDDTDNIWSFFNIIDSLQYSTPTERILNAMEDADQFVSFGEEQNFRMVFSMREDFLARLEDYSYNIPALRKNRIGLKPLNGLQALEVILKPRPEMVTRKVALHIISKVVGKVVTDNERKLEATSVDTSILSLFCTELYNYALTDNNGEISISLVDLYGGNILEWFYDRNMQILPKQTYVYLENQLLTHSGFRNSVALENLLENGVLQEQLDLLAENRIIRIEDVNHNLRVEFTHDVLCKIAKKRKDERDTIEKQKGENAAKRAFTIDNIILFSVFTFGLLAINYAGFDNTILATMVSLPFIIFLYAIIANRSVADKNLSNTIWFIIICLAVEGGLLAGMVSLEDTLKSKEEWAEIYGSLFWSILSFLPLGIILMPYAVLLKKEFSDGLQLFKSTKHSAFVYMAFLLVQCLLMYFWYLFFVKNHNGDASYYMQYLPYFLFPSIILALSPFYMLWKNKKNHDSMFISGCTATYTLYIVICSIIIWAQNEYRILPNSNSDANLIAIATIWVVIGVLCAFYAIQYMKQPKQHCFTDYYKNVLNFQSFAKYKSFKTRLFTILICYAIFIMGVIATRYIDIVPFFTLPIACLLTLYIGCSEFKFTKPKNIFLYKVLFPLIILTEIIVGCQYVIGYGKIIAIFVSSILLTLLVFFYMIHEEALHNRKVFALKVFGLSVFLGFLLPLICLGYNIFNTSLAPVCRIWDGAISSDARNIYFLKIEDAEGNVGVMDYDEIIIEPKYQRVHYSCYINTDIVKAVYPFRSMLMELLKVRYRGSGYSSYATDEAYEDIVSFGIMTNEGNVGSLSGSHFLEFENKYGKAYVDNWLSTYNPSKTSEMLSASNMCISDKEKRAAIVRIFLRELSTLCSNISEYTFTNIGNKSIRIYDSDAPDERLLKTCYNKASLKPLLDGCKLLSLDQVYRASLNSKYLFDVDSTANLKNFVLDELWDKLQSDSAAQVSYADKSLLMLITGKKDEAEKFSSTCMNKAPNDANNLINYCLIQYCNGKVDLMESTLRNYKARCTVLQSDVLFIERLYNKISDLKKCNIMNIEDEDIIINYFYINGIISIGNYKKKLDEFVEEFYIAAESTKMFSFQFMADDVVIVEVKGDGSTDLDLYVYGENHEEITKDMDSTDKCKCIFIPQRGVEYSIEIRNIGYNTNYSKIHVYQE